MQQKTEGRVVRLLSKHLAAEDRAVEQWFLVAIDDDEKAKEKRFPRPLRAGMKLLK
jgi:hypothetical protein